MQEHDPPDQLTRTRRCESLRHPEACWSRRIFSNGSEQLCYWCPTCGRAVSADLYSTPGQYVSSEWLRSQLGIEAEDLPEVRRDLYYRLCTRCGWTRLCELHHTAMRAAFADADEWPVMPLCDECHARWTQGYEAYVQRRIHEAIAKHQSSQEAA